MASTKPTRFKPRRPQSIQQSFISAGLADKPEGEIVEGEIAVVDATDEASSESTQMATVVEQASSVTNASCVRALQKSLGFARNAVCLEVSVALAYFAMSSTGADRATKRSVMEIYEQAGYDVAVGGPNYKTVSRRIFTASLLFNKLGGKAVRAAMHGLREGKAIDSLCSYLSDTYKFDSIYAVLEFVGKPVEQNNTPEVIASRAARVAAENNAVASDINEKVSQKKAEREKQMLDDSDGIIVFYGSLSLVIPRDCRSTEIRMMSAKLSEFADRMDAELGTPEEQRNREMHS